MDPGHIHRRAESITIGADRDVLPVVVLSAGGAPVVAITAGIHGDEVTGVAAAHLLDEILRVSLRQGTVALYPSLNPRGLVAQQRTLPQDGSDLNRLFPGDLLAQGTARWAADLWRDLLSRRPDAVIDLHADSAVSIPYVIVDRATSHRGLARQSMDARVLAMAKASGLLVLHEYPEDQYVRFQLDRSLAGAMVNRASVPALTIEVGPRRAVDPRSIQVASQAVLRVLAHLGLCEPPLCEPPASPLPQPPASGPWRRAPAPRVASNGLFEPALSPGEGFAAGSVLGYVRALDGSVREVITAESSGVVVSWSENAWVSPRAIPGTLGLVEDTAQTGSGGES